VRRAPSLQLTADARRVPQVHARSRAAREVLGMIDTIYGFGNGLIAAPWWTGAGWPVVWTLIKIVAGGAAPDGRGGLPDAVGTQGDRLHADPPGPQPRRPASAC
jgi:hypothetical protein